MRDVAIVGGGPAGALLATRLAAAGLDVVVLERTPEWHWRASGVFASPAAVAALERAGVSAAALAVIARPIPAMRLETPGGSVVRLTYGAEAGGPSPVGFDRAALDPLLLERARTAGATVCRGTTVRAVTVDRAGGDWRAELSVAPADGGRHPAQRITARVVVGADGARSRVARAVGVPRPVRLGARVGLSHHLPDPRTASPVDARMRVIRDGYVGIAPVPGGRVNVGIVLGRSWRSELAARGARAVAVDVLAAVPATQDDAVPWRDQPPCEPVAGVVPLGVRVTRRAGPGWFLVGDAAGFLDPFTGEGLHRAIVSTELAAPAIVAAVRRPSAADADVSRAADAYDLAMRRRFATKDALSWLVQTFLARPVLFEYAARRLAGRPGPREVMGLVMGDLVPASRGLDPRFLAAVLAP